MGVCTTLNRDLQEVDIIIAGGGAAGCIIAGRLAQADQALSILVVEAGPDNSSMTKVAHPIMFPTHLDPAAKMHHFYPGNPSPALGGRVPIVSTGGLLGGGTSVNATMYTRAQRADYDSWKTPGWSTDELIPYLKKLETYHGPGSLETHGESGPMHVSDGTYRSKRAEDALIAGGVLAGYPEIKDLQDLDSNNGVSRWSRWVSPDGRRQDTASRYLHPLLQDGAHENLHVLVQHKVLKVLLDEQGKRAVGVEFVANPNWPTAAEKVPESEETLTVRARKLVVLCAGAFGSPLILQRSGIGPTNVLCRAGVETVLDLPGVGANLQDHAFVVTAFKTNLEPHETADDLFTGRLTLEDALAKGDKRLGWNGIDVTGKVRPTEGEVAALSPAFQAAWARDFKDNPNKPLLLAIFILGSFGINPTPPPGQYLSVGMGIAYPYARGHIRITGPGINDAIDHDTPFYSDAAGVDLATHAWAYKKLRELVRRTAIYGGELAATHPAFPVGSAARPSDGPAGCEVEDIVYSADDDAALEAFLRAGVGTLWHSLGSAKMAPREAGGAVNAALDVYGVAGLKVADMSIAPENVGANTAGTALVIGEKAADIIAGELGLGTKY